LQVRHRRGLHRLSGMHSFHQYVCYMRAIRWSALLLGQLPRHGFGMQHVYEPACLLYYMRRRWRSMLRRDRRNLQHRLHMLR